MSKQLTMADLLAKQDKKTFTVSRGDQLQGTVLSKNDQEAILDLGTKAEGVLHKKDIAADQFNKLEVGDTLEVMVIAPENESGQTVVTTHKHLTQKAGLSNARWPRPAYRQAGSDRVWDKFETAFKDKAALQGKGLEVNKGGLIIEVNGIRGFLPSSQVSLSRISNIEDMVGQTITVIPIEVDPLQNRLIFSQKTDVSEDTKNKLGQIKISDKVAGKVAAVLPFGIFVSLPDGVEGLVHVSEIAWEKIDDPATMFKINDPIEALVISTDPNAGRVNLSIKQLMKDPFIEISKKYATDDILKGIVSKISNTGVYVSIDDGVEGLIPAAKLEQSADYQIGDTLTTMVDSIDLEKRRITLVPFITSTKGLIYK